MQDTEVTLYVKPNFDRFWVDILRHMEPALIESFRIQVHVQCQYFVFAEKLLSEGLKEDDTTKVFFAIETMLNTSAKIAKVFWSSGGAKSAAVANRAPLRNLMEVTDHSPLKEVLMRNHFEHFDERLEEQFNSQGTLVSADMNMGPTSFFSGGNPRHALRNFDPATKMVTFWGDTYDLNALSIAVWRLKARVEALE